MAKNTSGRRWVKPRTRQRAGASRLARIIRTWVNVHEVELRDLADEIGVSHSTLSRWLSGDRSLGPAAMMAVLSWLGGAAE